MFVYVWVMLICSVLCEDSLDVYFSYEDKINMQANFTKSTMSVKMKVDRVFAENSLTLRFKPYSNLNCPSYTHWFKKDSDILPSFSFGSSCNKYETAPSIKLAMAKDWERTVDEVRDGFWYFEGLLDYSETEGVNLAELGLLDVNEVRVRANSSTVESTYFTYFLETSTIILG